MAGENPRGTPFELEFYETADGDQPARRWMRELTPRKRRVLGLAMHQILAQMGVAVCDGTWGKPLGKGLYEFRLRDDEALGGRILLRVFFHPYGDNRVLLLGGYDKGEHPSKRYQEEQIERARRRLSDSLAQRRRGQ